MGKKETEAALLGYEKAVDLWIGMLDQFWSRFNVFVTINSIILAAWGISPEGMAFDFSGFSIHIRMILLVFGLFTCLVWLVLQNRTYQWVRYYINNAYEFEENYFENIIKITTRGRKYSKGEIVKFKTEDKSHKTMQMPGWLRRTRISRTANILIVGILIIYAIIIALEIMNL